MKTQIIKRLSSGLALAILPFVGGCNQQTGDTPQSLITAAQAEPILQPVAETTAATPTEPVEIAVVPAEKPEVIATPSEKTLPPSINPSSPLAEVIKLAQAGVDESVMYAFVTNSTSVFGLGSDEIIYLNDLGVTGPLVTAIIEHDKEVKQYWTNKAQAQAAAAAATNVAPAPENASGPAYINPPQPEPAPQPQVVEVSNNYFYDTLSPYGSWVYVNGFGRCWRPTVAVVNPGWQPYADRGRWVYSDAGWYWLSDYSWGATTFHYGRWFNQANVGWCWWPDTVWSPSWVSWRYSSGFCGWAPLPPTACYRPGAGFTYYGNSVGVNFGFGLSANCYTFVPTAYFCSPRPCNYRVPAHHANGLYNQTVVANNYIVGKNNTIINNGIPVEQVAATTRTEIRPVPIRETGAALRSGGRGERLESGGRAITVHRPNWPRTQDFAATTVATGSAQPVEAPHANNPGVSLNGPRSAQREQFDFANRRSHSSENAATVPTAGTPPEVTTTPVTRPDSRLDRNRPDNNSRPGQGRNSGSTPLMIRGPNVAVQPTAPTTPVTSPAVPSAPSSSLVVIGGRESNPSSARSPYGRPSSRDRSRENAMPSASTTTATAQQIASTPSQSPNTPVATAPASSLVVIGNRDRGTSQSRNVFAPAAARDRFGRPTTTDSTPQATRVPSQSAATPAAPSQFTSPAAPYQRQQNQRTTRNVENRAGPTTAYLAPTPAPRQAAPTQNYSAPASPATSVAQSTTPQSSGRGFGSQRNSNDGRRDRN